jgi:sugar lactone lactonase YvrE
MPDLPPDGPAHDLQFSAPRVVWEGGAALGEGLCWSPARQALYWVDILGQRLMRLVPATGERREWRFGSTISAVAERARGNGLLVSLRRGLAFFDPDSGALEAFGELEPQHPGNRFNDGKCDAQGRFWACSMDFGCAAPTGALHRATPGPAGPVAALAWACGFAVTNGPAWSADGRTMWLNDTVRGEVVALDVDPASGVVSNPRPWLRLLPNDGLPDGMTTDAAGRLWLAHWGGGCVTCHAPDDARELARIALPVSQVTNVCFGGPDLTTLYVSSAAVGLSREQLQREPLAGALFAVPTGVRGVAPNRFAG